MRRAGAHRTLRGRASEAGEFARGAQAGGLAAELARAVQVWCLLLLGACLPIRRDLALPLGFAAATARVWRDRCGRPRQWRSRPALDLGLLALAALLEPVLRSLIGALGLWIGLPAPFCPATGPSAGPGEILSRLVLAPLFEEALYRQDLQRALESSCGRLAATLVSSALFALSHLRPWPVLGTFVVGLLLALLRRRSGRLAACVAFHAGLNLAALLRASGTSFGA